MSRIPPTDADISALEDWVWKLQTAIRQGQYVLAKDLCSLISGKMDEIEDT